MVYDRVVMIHTSAVVFVPQASHHLNTQLLGQGKRHVSEQQYGVGLALGADIRGSASHLPRSAVHSNFKIMTRSPEHALLARSATILTRYTDSVLNKTLPLHYVNRHCFWIAAFFFVPITEFRPSVL